MNSKKSLALGVGICALALTAVATPVKAADTTAQSTITQTYQPKTQNVTINYKADFGIAVWLQPGKNVIPGKFVPGQSTVKVAGSQVVNGHTWYLLADNSGWIDGSYVKIEASAPAKTTTTTNKTTNTNTNTKTDTTKTPAKSDSKTVYADEIVTASSNGAVVYSAPSAAAKTSRTLAKGSNWKSFYRVENGSTWYNLGGNQFVLASDLATKNTSSTAKENKPADTKKDTTKTNTTSDKNVTVVASKIVKVDNAKGAVIYSKPTTTAKTSRVLPNGSRWKTFLQTDNGMLWYNLGGNQWVLASDLDASTSTKKDTTKTNNSNNSGFTDYSKVHQGTGTVTVHYKPGYGIAVWSQPGKNAIPGKYLKHGTSWKYFKYVNVNGTIWYNLGGNQWVSGQYLINKNPEGIARYNYLSNFTVKISNPKGAKVYADPNSGITTGRVLPKNSNWKAYQVLGNGDRWYNLGGNQWVMQEDTWN
ncbi:SLAP domain-containing protein [Lactobacillus hominis]|uniref:SLAP domain-containing protein n=1 Tax=Lactobacillus hominis TaxID=1203033 RepID=UPI0023F4DB9F|nr:SLAP domain-containing protein [Lactobacillus hominis]